MAISDDCTGLTFTVGIDFEVGVTDLELTRETVAVLAGEDEEDVLGFNFDLEVVEEEEVVVEGAALLVGVGDGEEDLPLAATTFFLSMSIEEALALIPFVPPNTGGFLTALLILEKIWASQERWGRGRTKKKSIPS